MGLGLAVVALLLNATSALAIPTRWQLQGVTFGLCGKEDPPGFGACASGGTASGYFVLDGSQMLDFAVTVAGGDTGIFPPVTYTPALGSGFVGSDLVGPFRTVCVVLGLFDTAPRQRSVGRTPTLICFDFSVSILDAHGPLTIVNGQSTASALSAESNCLGGVGGYPCNRWRYIVSGSAVPTTLCDPTTGLEPLSISVVDPMCNSTSCSGAYLTPSGGLRDDVSPCQQIYSSK